MNCPYKQLLKIYFLVDGSTHMIRCDSGPVEFWSEFGLKDECGVLSDEDGNVMIK